MGMIAMHTLATDMPFLADGGFLEMLAVNAIFAVISIGVSLISGALFKPKQPSDLTNFPPNQITRGGYLPVVIGRRAVGCNIGFVGDRKSYAAPHSGGSEINAQPSSGNIYLEAGWHQLCHGPTRQTLRVWTGATVISSGKVDFSTASDGVAGTLLNNTQIEGDHYSIYSGRDSNVDPSFQPANTYLYDLTNIPSSYPGLTYFIWHRKNLGYSPVWPLMKYEVETRPDDIMTAAGLTDIFTPASIPIWFDESTPAETGLVESGVIGVTVWLNGKASLPAGTYNITYLYGAFKLSPTSFYQVFSYDSLLLNFEMNIVDTSGTKHGQLPWTSSGDNLFATQQEAEAANAGASMTVTWPGGPMGFRVVDVYHRPAMVPGAPNPTYSVQLTTGGPTYTAAVAVQGGAPGSGDSGCNPATALWILLCAPFPYGCGIPTNLIDQTALLAVGTQLAAERLVVNIIAEQGRDASDIVASLMADVGMLLPQVGGLLKPYLIRTETTIPEIVDDLRVGAPPEQQQLTAPVQSTRITFQLNDCLNNYAISDITLDNDAAAQNYNRPQTQTIKLENITSRTVAQQVAYRRAVEIYSTPNTVPAFTTLRETRNPAFHPGRSFLMDGSQYRVASWKPDMRGVSCEIGAVLDQYGDTSVTFDTTGGGDSFVIPPASAPLPDLFFAPFVIPRSEWPASNSPVFGVPRIRANDAVAGAAVWISNSSTGTYTQIGTQDQPSAGGLLLADMNTSTGVMSISPYVDNDDITEVPDLTGDPASYAQGALTVFIDSEIMLMESVTANTDGSYTLNDITRGAFNTTPANHSAGTPAVIIQYENLTPNASPLLALLSPAGGTLWIKTQPTDGNTWVDLSTVTAEPLVVPENLLATISMNAPAGASRIYIGDTLSITWTTTNLTGTLNIDLSEDNGATWSSIAAGVADVGSYAWNTSGATPSTTATVRVSSSTSPTVYAVSYPFLLVADTVLPAFNVSGPVTNVGPVSYFGNGKYYPPGNYTVAYLFGAISYIGDPAALNINGNTTTNCYQVVHSNGATVVTAPGNTTTYTTLAALEAANAGATVSIVHTGGTIGIQLSDMGNISDNTPATTATMFGLS